MPQTIATVREIRIAQPKPFARGQISGIDKQPVTGPIEATPTGLVGDGVGDPRQSPALLRPTPLQTMASPIPRQSALPRRRLWRKPLHRRHRRMASLPRRPMANRQRPLRSQPRPPALLETQRTLRRARYRRPSAAQSALRLVRLLARAYADWPLSRILELIDSRNCQPQTMREVLQLPLPPSWQHMFQRRLDTGECEDWQRRLFG